MDRTSIVNISAEPREEMTVGPFRYLLENGSVTVCRRFPAPLRAAPSATLVTMQGRKVAERRYYRQRDNRQPLVGWAYALANGAPGLPYLVPLTLMLLFAGIIAAERGHVLLALLCVVMVPLLLVLNHFSKLAVVFYLLDEDARASFQGVCNAVRWVGGMGTADQLLDPSSTEPYLYNPRVAPVTGSLAGCTDIRTPILVPRLLLHSSTVTFFPDLLLLKDGTGVRLFHYPDLEFSVVPRWVGRLSPVPLGLKVVGRTWQHVNKNGDPDRRYRHNPEWSIIEYTQVTLRTGDWQTALLFSNAKAATHFVQGLTRHAGQPTSSRAVAQAALSTATPRTVAKPAAVASPSPAVTSRATVGGVGTNGPSAMRYRITRPESPQVDPDQLWIPRGHPVEIGGYRINAGMIYVGEGLRGRWREADPALIDPTLPVSTMPSGEPVPEMSYYPSYSEIAPANRAEYLRWLAGGRSDPSVRVGYVFLFFYGMERRALVDATTSARAKADRLVIGEEIDRLLSIYSQGGSFRSYATSFLSALEVLSSSGNAFYRRPAPAIAEQTWAPVPVLSLALGQCARDQSPLPADWALAWLRSYPEAHLRTPAHRCAAEFDELFKLRYRDALGEGLLLKPGKGRAKVTYRPASSSIMEIPLSVDVPSLMGEKATLQKLRAIAESCMKDLDGFSRWLGKNPEGRSRLAALAHLPRELHAASGYDDANTLRELLTERLVDSSFVSLILDDLLSFFGVADPSRLRKNEAVMLAQALEHLGFGVEPDVRFGGKALGVGEPIVVFRQGQDAPSAPTGEYSAAVLLLHFAAMVATADDHVASEEVDTMSDHISRYMSLAADERARLRAHLQWLLITRPGTSGVKKRMETLSRNQRESIGDFVVSVAAADGQISPAEVDVLTKIYQLLGLDTSSLFGILHAAAIDAGSTASASFAGGARESTTPGSQVDMKAVERKLADTAAVSALLADIFREDGEQTSEAPTGGGCDPVVDGLDSRHSRFLRRLSDRSCWPREEIELMASELDLLVDGALETINDMAFDRFGEPLWEGEDPLELNLEIAGELMQ